MIYCFNGLGCYKRLLHREQTFWIEIIKCKLLPLTHNRVPPPCGRNQNFFDKTHWEPLNQASASALVERLLPLPKSLRHKGINGLGETVLDRSEDQPHVDMWLNLHRLKALRLKEHVSLQRCTTRKLVPTWGSPYTCPLPSLITRCITRRRLWPTRAYTRVNLFHPQGTFSLSTTLLTHSFSVPLLTWASES
jgi:hypothetical protein